MQVKSVAGLGGVSIVKTGKREPAQARGKEGESSGLRTPEQKVAAALIGQKTIFRTTRLPRPTQSDAPKKARAKNRNLTVVFPAVKVAQ